MEYHHIQRGNWEILQVSSRDWFYIPLQGCLNQAVGMKSWEEKNYHIS